MYFVVIAISVLTLGCMIIFTNDETSTTYTLITAVKDKYVPVTAVENSVSRLGHTRFVICSSYWEQQTNAILNMWSLQKWANITGFRVVEPFAHQSTLGLTYQVLHHYNYTNALRFSDYFDLDFWNAMCKENHGILPLEKWNTFALAPKKKTVVVILVYYRVPEGVYIDIYTDKLRYCREAKKTFYDQHAKLFDRLQIQVVRNVCFIFNQKKRFTVSLDKFNSHILQNYSDVNVWFSAWRGIDPHRVPIVDHKELFRNHEGEENILGMARTSPMILKDSKKYVNTILNANFNKYVAVAFRTANRKTALVASGYSRNNVMQYFYKCSEEVKQALLPSSAKFLAIDLGRFGDLTAVYGYFKINDDGTKLFNFVLNKVYGNKSIDDYENELIRAANGIEDSGYIGSMQKTITENAGQLIVVGGYSSFQRSMMLNFRAKNHNCQDCVICICYK